MKTAKTTIFAALAAVGALTAVAAPAAAQQPYRGDHGRYEQDRYEQNRYEQNRAGGERTWEHGDRYGRLARIAERRIDRGVDNGSIDRREAWRLMSEVREFARLEARFGANGFDWRERQLLDRRFDRLMAQVRIERSDRDYGYGYGPRR